MKNITGLSVYDNITLMEGKMRKVFLSGEANTYQKYFVDLCRHISLFEESELFLPYRMPTSGSVLLFCSLAFVVFLEC